MYSVNRSALVMHSAKNMFDLVNDVGRYPEFLPWCGGSEVLSSDSDQMVASVTIAFKGIEKQFTTRNTLIQNEKTIVELVDGPFSDLSGEWRYTALSDTASKIELSLKFGFSNVLVGKVVGPIFHAIADSMVDSFCKRADQLYGSGE
ncbi:MAG: type II toxin-antitoxin system RatA family toxin [Pseudomonadota bacterium]